MSLSLLKRLVIGGKRIAGELREFPIFMTVSDSSIKDMSIVNRIRFTLSDGQKPLAHEVVSVNSEKGELSAWVRLPEVSPARDTIVQLCLSETGDASPPPARGVWDEDYRLVVHDVARPEDSSVYVGAMAVKQTEDGQPWLQVTHADPLDVTDAVTVEAWVEDKEGRAEAVQMLVSKWAVRDTMDRFDAYDAGHTDGMDTGGFFGGVFDGRYLYFAPQHDKETRHGRVLRYDTHGDLREAASWSAYDAGNTDGLNTKGFYGAVFDGRFVYFPPRRNPEGFHANVLRYDTKGDFKDAASWSAYDAGAPNSSQSAAFDGRYIYFCPGQESRLRTQADVAATDGPPTVTGARGDEICVASGRILRYDTQRPLKDAASWVTFGAEGTSGLDTRDFDGAVFDGRYVYFVPLSYGAILRYDTHGDFCDRSSWAAYDGAKRGLNRCVGGIFDGRYVYMVPYGATPVLLRYDTSRGFLDDTSWETLPLREIPGLPVIGFDGACFDGRYIYYIPYWDEGSNFHGVMLHYDTSRPFTEPASWHFTDAGVTDGLTTKGFNGGLSDGRYIYCVPWMDGAQFPKGIIGNGRVLRYDTVGENGAFSLRYCDVGHNGGLTAALPGARFLINTVNGPVSVSANRNPQTGWHHLAGVYDGKCLRLYIDGELVNEQACSGKIVSNDVDAAIGRMLNGGGQFRGKISEVRISDVARSADYIRTQYNNLNDPTGFCRVADG